MNEVFTSPDSQPPHVLLVDDQPYARLLMKRIIDKNVQITEASDGHEALEILEHEKIDLVLLDIMMPGISGIDVLKLIRKQRSTADLPVIMISALDDNESMAQGFELGANDYIPKPFDFGVASARIRTHLKLKLMTDYQKQVMIELEAAKVMKERLLQIAAHDLKSPLSNVNLAERLLRDIITSDPTVASILDTLRSTVNNMNQVIEDFLEMEAIEGSNIAVQLTSIDAHEIIMNVIEQFQYAAESKDIRIEVEDIDNQVYADPTRLTQVLSNLISNALKYSPRNTSIRIFSQIYNERVRLYVADSGPGIPANERPNLFQEFTKLSPRPTAGESSTGLGLWIVKHLAQIQGGKVGADFPEDNGSIFWVELPTVPE